MSVFNLLLCDLFIVTVSIMGLTLWFLVKVTGLAYINGERHVPGNVQEAENSRCYWDHISFVLSS